MKKLFLLTTLAFWGIFANAQTEKSKMPSPPASAIGKINGKNITIKYHQPAVNGRSVWDTNGSLAPYGKVWRTGANNATTFEVDQDINIEGKNLPKGKYALFTIPGEKEWVIIFNSKAAQWGNYSYKAEQDVLRVTVPSTKSTAFNERFLISIDTNAINLNWENVKVDVKLN
jgi:hypothetical protein